MNEQPKYPISYYKIMGNKKVAGTVKHNPQTLKSKPFSLELTNADAKITVIAVDKAVIRAETIFILSI